MELQDTLAPAAMVSANDLPSDLFFDIFSKMPVKSLGRFKSLSKTFHSLIRNPNFISKHVNSQTESVSLFQCPDFDDRDLALYSLVQEPKLEEVGYLRCNHVRDYKVATLVELGGSPGRRVRSVVACCRGLVCLASKQMNGTTKRLFLWNPATRATKLIYEAPDTPVRDEWCRVNYRYIRYGFGYDTRAKDCKLARLSLILKYTNQFQIYSVNSGTWGAVKDFTFRPNDVVKCYSMVSANGHLYCLLKLIKSSSSKFTIQSYNFSTDDSIREIAVPEECKGARRARITELDGNLGLLVSYRGRKDVDLWMMKEEEGSDHHHQVSWMKSFRVVSPPLHYVEQVITWKGFMVYSCNKGTNLCFSIVGSQEPYRFITSSYYFTNALFLYRETLLLS